MLLHLVSHWFLESKFLPLSLHIVYIVLEVVIVVIGMKVSLVYINKYSRQMGVFVEGPYEEKRLNSF